MNLPEGFHALRVPIPDNPLGFLLSYLIADQDGLTLIDSGWNSPEAYQSLVSQLNQLGFDLKDVRRIILTHMHPDHSGLANQIRRESGARVICHELEAPRIGYADFQASHAGEASGASYLVSCGVPRDIYQNTRFGSGGHRRPNFPEPDDLLVGGELIEVGGTKLEVIWTPGHAMGHICLYDRKNKILFAGDHVLPVTTPNISLRWSTDGPTNPLSDYLSSLQKLSPLEVDVVLPAHDHIFTDLQGRLAEIEHHHELRLGEMIDSANGKWTTPFEVARRVTWTIGPFDSLENVHKVMAVGETFAHLEFLEKRGQLAKKKSEDGLLSYRTMS